MENNNETNVPQTTHKMMYDIMRDNNSLKFSMTKFAALIGIILLTAIVMMSLYVMWMKQEIDHVLLVELIGYVLTLLGFKNNFGIKSKDSTTTDDNQTSNQVDVDAEQQKMTVSRKFTDKTNDRID